MTTAEVTISMINRLPESDLLRVQKYVRALEEETYPPKVTEREFIHGIKKSLRQAKAGKTISREVARERARAKYGI